MTGIALVPVFSKSIMLVPVTAISVGLLMAMTGLESLVVVLQSGRSPARIRHRNLRLHWLSLGAVVGHVHDGARLPGGADAAVDRGALACCWQLQAWWCEV